MMDPTTKMLILHNQLPTIPLRREVRQAIDAYVLSLRNQRLSDDQIRARLAEFFSYEDAPYAPITVSVINEVMTELAAGVWHE